MNEGKYHNVTPYKGQALLGKPESKAREEAMVTVLSSSQEGTHRDQWDSVLKEGQPLDTLSIYSVN